MIFRVVTLLTLLMSISADAAPPFKRREVDAQVQDALLKLKIGTLLTVEGLEVAPFTAPEIDLDGVRTKTGWIQEFGHSFAVIPHEIKTVGRKLGRGPMVFFITLEAAHILLPIVAVAIGQPELTALVVGPDTIPLMALFFSVREISQHRKEVKAYGGREDRKKFISEREELLKGWGLKTLKTDILIDELDRDQQVISRKHRRKFKNQISLKRLKQELKSKGLWNHKLSRVAKDVSWKKEEKIFLILSQINAFRPVTTQEEPSEIESWLYRVAKIQKFSQFGDLFKQMPKQELPARVIYRSFESLLIPYWSEHMREKGIKKYHCLFKNTPTLKAAADLAGDQLWSEADESQLRNYFSKCKVL